MQDPTAGNLGAGVAPRRQRIYKDLSDCDRRLSEIGLSRKIVEESVKRGLLARLECTPNHPRTAPGLTAWMETVAKLREMTAPNGFVPDNESNQGLVVNRSLGIALNVAAGDDATGVEHRNPSTRSRKGPKMADAVAANNLSLFDDAEPEIAEGKREQHLTLWLVLAYWNREKHRVQLEVSCPRGMGENKRPVDWSERILFPAIDYNDPLSEKTPVDGSPKTPEIVIEIKRRA